MYIRNYHLTSPLVILATVIAVVVANIPQSGYQYPEPGYTFEEPTAAVRLVNEIAEEVKKWVLPDQHTYLPPSSGPQPETVKVKIPACEPVKEYITTHISQNVAVRTHCMQKSVYRHPDKRELMHQSSQCRGHFCNPQPLSDPYVSDTTYLQLPTSLGSDPLASIFSNVMNDYNQYDYNVEPDPSAVDIIEYPAYDYYDETNRQPSQTYPPKESWPFLTKGKLLHSDRNVDLSDPNFGLPNILFQLDRPKQSDFQDQLSRPKQLRYIYSAPAPTDDFTIDYVYEAPIDNSNFRSAISDVYGTPVDNNNFRSAISDVYETPVDDNSFRSALSDSPTFLLQYHPNYVIPPGTKRLDLSHGLQVTVSGAGNIPTLSTNFNVQNSGNQGIHPLNPVSSLPNARNEVGIPIPIIENPIPNTSVNGGLTQSPDSSVPRMQVGISIPKLDNVAPNNGVNQGSPLSQGSIGIPIPKFDNPIPNNNVNQRSPLSQGSVAPNNPQIGLNNPGSQVGISIPKIDNPIANVNQGLPLSQGSVAPNNPQIGSNNLGSQVGIPIPKIDNPIPNNSGNQGLPLSQGSSVLNNPQIGLNDPGSQVGIPIPKNDNPIPNNGVNQGFPLSQGSATPNNPQNGLNNPGSQVGIPIPKIDNPIPNNGVNQGFSLSQGSTAPNNPQIDINNQGAQVGIPIPKSENSITNNGVSPGLPSSHNSAVLSNNQIGNTNPNSQVGIPIPKLDQPISNGGINGDLSFSQGSTIPIDSQISIRNTNPGMGIPIPNNGANADVFRSQDSAAPNNLQMAIPNSNLQTGIPIPNIDNSRPNNGVSRDISLSKGLTIPTHSQIAITNSNPGIGIQLPSTIIPTPNSNVNGGIPLSQAPNSNPGIGIQLPSTIIPTPNSNVNGGIPLSQGPNSNPGIGIPIPRTNIPAQNNGHISMSQGLTVTTDSQIAIPNSNLGFGIQLPSTIIPTPNSNVNGGIPFSPGPTVPVDSLINIIKLHNPNLQIEIPTLNLRSQIQTNGVIGGGPLLQGSTVSGDSQIVNPNSDLGFALSLPGANQGINMLRKAIIIVDSQDTITNIDAPVGIPLSVVDNSNAINVVNTGSPNPNNGVNVGIPIPNIGGNVNNPASNNVANVGASILNKDVNIGIPLPQNSATQSTVNNAGPEVGIPIPTADNSSPRNDNTLDKYPYGYPNQMPNIATITQLNLSHIPFDFSKSSSNTGYSPPSHDKPSPSYSNPFNVKFSPSQNNYVAKASDLYKGPIPEHT